MDIKTESEYTKTIGSKFVFLYHLFLSALLVLEGVVILIGAMSRITSLFLWVVFLGEVVGTLLVSRHGSPASCECCLSGRLVC